MENIRFDKNNWHRIGEAFLNPAEVSNLTIDEKKVYQLLNEYRNDSDILYALRHVDEDNAWESISNKLNIDRNSGKRVRIKRLSFFVKIAAVFCVFLGTALWLINNQRKNKNSKEVVVLNGDVAPGTNKATLLYDSTHSVNLDMIKFGEININNSNIKCRIEDGKLIYDCLQNVGVATTSINSVITPRGGQYKIELADGTKVWLNAASSIRFPVPFSNSERLVEVNGEAYFEVAKDKNKPFIVQLSGQNKVTVLGTHFDVKAYRDEKSIKTTLLEGKVKVNNAFAEAYITPGKQVMTASNGKLIVSTVDTSIAVAWKNGYFNFNNDDLETVMKQICRWYNVKVIYQNNNLHQHFFGEIQRNLNLSEILQVLEKSNIHFKIKNQTITVMP